MTHTNSFVVLLAVSLKFFLAVSSAFATEPPITSLAFTPDGDSVVACSQAGITVYRWPELTQVKKIDTRALNIHDLQFSPGGERLAVAGGNPAEMGMVEIFAWPSGESLRILREHDDSVLSVAWRDDSTLVTASLDHSIIHWDLDSGSVIQRLNGHSRGVSTLCFLKGGDMLVSAGIDQSLRTWEMPTGKLLRSMSNHTQPVHGLALRPAEGGLPMVASASDDKTVRLWQPTIGRMVKFARLTAAPLDVAWLNDGSQIVAACTDGHVRFIDPVSVEVTRDVPALNGWAYAIAVHPTEGDICVGGQDGQVRRVSTN